VVLLQEGRIVYTNDLFLLKFKPVIRSSQVIATEIPPIPPKGCWARFKQRICRRQKKEMQFDSSFILASMFLEYKPEAWQEGIRKSSDLKTSIIEVLKMDP